MGNNQAEIKKVEKPSNGSLFGGFVELAEFISNVVVPEFKSIREIEKDNKRRLKALRERQRKREEGKK